MHRPRDEYELNIDRYFTALLWKITRTYLLDSGSHCIILIHVIYTKLRPIAPLVNETQMDEGGWWIT
jgi:hypothetical protein